MADEKDRLGDKLKDKERAEEDRYFQQRDREAVERLRREQAPQSTGSMQCPKDGTPLAQVAEFGVTVEECPKCRGMWVEAGEAEVIARRERDSWLGKLFYRPRR